MKLLKCHCGKIEAEINIKNLGKILRCNCSLCKRKGAIMTLVKNEDFNITKGKDQITLYKFHTKIANHYFCKSCGVYTQHNPRSNPAMTGVNLGCIDEIDTFELNNVTVNDGKNHPLDKN